MVYMARKSLWHLLSMEYKYKSMKSQLSKINFELLIPTDIHEFNAK